MTGAKFSGKTSVVRRFTEGVFDRDVKATIVGDMKSKVFKYKDCVVDCTIWDTSGEEKYKSIVKSYFRDANLCMAVFSLDSL